MASIAPNLDECNHLIIVCCHAIYKGGPNHGAAEDEWIIEPFQGGETPTFIEHLKAGLHAFQNDAHSILVLSGGATKKRRTQLSEGQSYLNLARDNDYFQDQSAPQFDPSRVIAEIKATDSYQNVLFSLIRFKVHTGVFPQKVTVVTHEFKRARFVQCHFPAVGLLPIEPDQERYTNQTTVIGINPPENVTPSESLVRGEVLNGIGLWEKDLYGVGHDLQSKRSRRGWVPGMEEMFSNMDLEDVVLELVRYDGGRCGNEWFPKRENLPWSYAKNDGTKEH